MYFSFQSFNIVGVAKLNEPTYLDPLNVVETIIKYSHCGFNENKSKYGT